MWTPGAGTVSLLDMTSLMSEAGRKRVDPFAQVEALEAAIESTAREADQVKSEAVQAELKRDLLRPVRPHANSLFAYFWAPKTLPPVPEVTDEPDVDAIRSDRSRAEAAVGAAYRDDADAARARIAGLEEHLDRERTRLARAQQRLDRAERERARRAERAELDERFSAKEYVQLVTFLALIVAAAVVLYYASHRGRHW